MSEKYTKKELAEKYNQLDPVNKRKVSEYISHVLYIQKAETEAEEEVDRIRSSIEPGRDADGRILCSLCGRAEGETKLIVAAGTGVAICYECVDTLAEIKQDDRNNQF